MSDNKVDDTRQGRYAAYYLVLFFGAIGIALGVSALVKHNTWALYIIVFCLAYGWGTIWRSIAGEWADTGKRKGDRK